MQILQIIKGHFKSKCSSLLFRKWQSPWETALCPRRNLLEAEAWVSDREIG